MKQQLQHSRTCEAVSKINFTNLTSTDYERLMFRLVVAWLLSKEFGITMPV